MNQNSNNQYQESQTYVDPNANNNNSGNNNQGYNDTYYDSSYNSNNNQYNNSSNTSDQKSGFNWKLIAIIIGVVLIVGILLYLFLNNGKSGEQEYNALTTRLCNAALEYEGKNTDIIDTNTPGATAYISLKTLSDNYYIESVIKDPRYRTGLFAKNTVKQYIPMTAYIRLAVASNGEVYCEKLIDTSDDKTAPILTLKGESTVEIATGINFEDPGATAIDDMDGDITNRITRSGSVDVTKVGTYTITYRVTDMAGNSTSKDRKIEVKDYKDLDPTAAAALDVTPPQIQIKGNNPLCIVTGSKYIEPGVTAIDNVDGNITNKIIVDNGVTGERTGVFRVTYTVKDNAGNTSVAYRSVEVSDSCSAAVPPTKPTTPVNTAPTISLIGGDVNWNINEPYIERGATAWDKEDGDITKNIKVDATEVNVGVAGSYYVYYTVTDSGGLRATNKRRVTILDPNSNGSVAHFLSVPSNLKYAVGDVHDIPVPQAQDTAGNYLTVTTTIKNPAGAVISAVDFYTPGIYSIVYSAKPAGGVEQTVSRTVTIYDTKPPVIKGPDSIIIPVRGKNCDLTVQDLINAGITAIDSSSQMARIEIKSGKVNVCSVGQKGTITIDAVDDYGNTSEQKTITVEVNEDTSSDVTGVSIINCDIYGKAYGTLNLNVGDSFQFSSGVFPLSAKNKNVSWSSTNPEIVSVDPDSGKATAKAKGSAYINVTTEVGAKTDTCQVIVAESTTPKPVTDVAIQGCESGTLSLNKGLSRTLIATVTPADAANKAVTWTSSNPSIATINDQGGINTLAVGTTTLTVKTVDGNKTKTCALSVKDQATPTDSTPPAKVALTANTANPSDPYNKSGGWAGGATAREITLTAQSSDSESGIYDFEILDSSDKVLAQFNPLVSDGNKGQYVWKNDANETIYIRAVNNAGLAGPKSDPIILKLDNSGPTTSFTQSLGADQWVNTKSYTVKFNATDVGVGLDHYEYTHDDVKTVKDPKIEGSTVTGEKTFDESLTRDYVYVRAVDKLGNAGEWTTNPSYLHMDSVAPNPPGINISAQAGDKVTVGFTFSDGTSPHQSGFGKYTYLPTTTSATEEAITAENGTYDMTNDTATTATRTVTAYAWDKAGNKSAAAIKSGIQILPALGVSCPSSSITTGTKIVCKLSGVSANETGVKLECLNGSYSRSFTTISSDKTIYCIPSNAGTLTVKATKAGWADGSTNVTVTKSGSTGGGDKTALSIDCPSSVEVGTSITVKANLAVASTDWAIAVKNGTSSTSINPTSSTSDGKQITIATGSIAAGSTVSVQGKASNGTTSSCSVSVATKTTTPAAPMSCTPTSSSITVGTSVTCTSTVSTVQIYCAGAGHNNQPTLGNPMSCTPTTTGTLTFVAQGSGYTTSSKEYTVTAPEPTLTLVGCSSGSVSMDKGATKALGAKLTNLDATIKYVSNNSSVAAVDNYGTVTAVSAGQAVVTAYTGDSRTDLYNRTCVINVASAAICTAGQTRNFKWGSEPSQPGYCSTSPLGRPFTYERCNAQGTKWDTVSDTSTVTVTNSTSIPSTPMITKQLLWKAYINQSQYETSNGSYTCQG